MGEANAGILVVGAGAAGLWAAARAAEQGARVLLLEKTQRTGTKVLASGGTRCNLTTTLGPDDAARLFGKRGERFLRRAFRALPPRAVRERFASLGVPTVEAPLEKVFPASDRARDVRDALERWARQSGVAIEFGVDVQTVEPGPGRAEEASSWSVLARDGRRFTAARLLLCPGGCSYPRTGTTGDGYAWLRALDLPLVPPVPALVPLVSPEPWVHALTGIALQQVDVRLVAESGERLGERRRPIVFTHHGVSGPGAMDLSEPVARAVHEEGGAAPTKLFHLNVDLLPELEREELRARVLALAGQRGAPPLGKALRRTLDEAIPRRVMDAVMAQVGLRRDRRVNELSRAQRHELIEALKGFAIPVHDTLGFEKAEVTAGGLALSAVDPGTLEVRGRAGLHVFGELLDLSGPIGGLNFQAAFATAELAARAAAGC